VNTGLRERLEGLDERLQEVRALLTDPEVIGNQERYRALSREYAEVEPVVGAYRRYRKAEDDLFGAREMLQDGDPDLRALAEEELARAEAQRSTLERELRQLLLPRDPADERNLFVEVRAGTGGDEAALFAGDLFRMYSRYAEARGWVVEVLSASPGEHGGYKEVIARIIGRGAYSRLKFESGGHRVQRVPATEAQGRIHTSACTVAVLAEADEQEAVTISPSDLRVDTYRASGAGGQHVNKTDSAIRLTHLPTGIVVECQDERSQHKNRARAMALLQAKLFAMERDRRAAEQAATRKSLIGSGDRSERVRTYNFPQGRVTDHRINLTMYKLQEVLDGGLDAVVDPIIAEHQAEQLAVLGG